MPEPVAEFMRFTAVDTEAHARGIGEMRVKLEQALQAGEPLAIVDHAADLAGMLTTWRQEGEALELLRRHAAAAEQLPSEEPAGWFWNAYATALQYCGHREEAETYFAKAVRLCEQSGWTRLQAMALHHWGRSLAEQKRFDEAQARIAEALALRVQLGDQPRQEFSRRALQELAQLRGAA